MIPGGGEDTTIRHQMRRRVAGKLDKTSRLGRQQSLNQDIGHAAANTYLATHLSFKLLRHLGDKEYAVVENPGFWNWAFTLKDIGVKFRRNTVMPRQHVIFSRASHLWYSHARFLFLCISISILSLLHSVPTLGFSKSASSNPQTSLINPSLLGSSTIFNSPTTIGEDDVYNS